MMSWLEKRVAELERLNLESRQREADAVQVIGDIEQLRAAEGDSVEILCDNPGADSIDQQTAVEVSAEFTGWRPQRWHGRTWTEALHKAANASRSYYASEE
jgi:hypothetical protein